MSVVWNCCYDCVTGWGPQTALSRAVLLSCYFFLPAGPWLQGAVPWKLWGRESFRGGKKQRSLFVCDLSRAVPPAPSQAMQNTWGLQGKTQCLILKQSTMLSQRMEKGRCYPIGIALVLRCLGIIGQYHAVNRGMSLNFKAAILRHTLFPWGKHSWSIERLTINKLRGGTVPL